MKAIALVQFLELCHSVVKNEKIVFDFNELISGEHEVMLSDPKTYHFFEHGLAAATKAIIAVSPLVQLEFVNFPESCSPMVTKLYAQINNLRVWHITNRVEKGVPL